MGSGRSACNRDDCARAPHYHRTARLRRCVHAHTRTEQQSNLRLSIKRACRVARLLAVAHGGRQRVAQVLVLRLRSASAQCVSAAAAFARAGPGALALARARLLGVVDARHLGAVLQVADEREGVHVPLAVVHLRVVHELAALQHAPVAAPQHAARLHLRLRDVYVEAARRAAVSASAERRCATLARRAAPGARTG